MTKKKIEGSGSGIVEEVDISGLEASRANPGGEGDKSRGYPSNKERTDPDWGEGLVVTEASDPEAVKDYTSHK